MAGSITAYVAVEQTQIGPGRQAVCNVVVSNNSTGAPVTISSIALASFPAGAPCNIDGLQFGGGGGGAATSVPSTNVTVNSGSQLWFAFGASVPANVFGNPTNVQVGGNVYLSDGTVVVITPAQITSQIPATATAGSGDPPAPIFNQSPGALLFASNNNSSLDSFLSDD